MKGTKSIMAVLAIDKYFEEAYSQIVNIYSNCKTMSFEDFENFLQSYRNEIDYQKQREVAFRLTLAWGVSALAFPLTLGLFQIMMKPIGISTNGYILNRMMSLISLSTSAQISGSIFSIIAFKNNLAEIENPLKSRNPFENLWNETNCDKKLLFNSFWDTLTMEFFLSNGATTILIFLLLGGNLKSLVPSCLLSTGAFSRFSYSLPVLEKGPYANGRERGLIQHFGKIQGCHTCGIKRGKFIADHQPPNAMVTNHSWRHRQRFYPHCKQCSETQGTILSAMSLNKNGNFFAKLKTGLLSFLDPMIRPKQSQFFCRSVITHGSRLRLYHLWIPIYPIFVHFFSRKREFE